MDIQKLITDELNAFMSTLDETERGRYKVKKSAIVFNIVSKYRITPAEMETICNLLFQDKNETFEEIKTRIECKTPNAATLKR